MNPKAAAFQPSIFGLSVEGKKIMETIQAMSKQVATLLLDPPTTFTRFMELPAELRKIIWEYVLTFPQVHRVAPNNEDRNRFFPGSMIAIKYNAGLRRVCWEAREEVSKVQELYSTAKLNVGRKQRGTPSIFVNPEIDTIFMGNMDCMFPKGGKPRTYVGKTKRLAFLWNHWTIGMDIYDYTPSFLSAREDKKIWCMGLWEQGVEEIILVLGDYRNCFAEPELIQFIEPVGCGYSREFGLMTPFDRKEIEGQLESVLNECQERFARGLKPRLGSNQRGECPGMCLRSHWKWEC
jgi:hypothetical protein